MPAKSSKKSASKKRPNNNRFIAHLHAISQSPNFKRRYALLSVVLLVASTLYWSYLSAVVQQSNADQLVDAYLFQDAATFHGAVFPNQHTFLLKWPLFLLVKFAGFTSVAFVASSMFAALVSVLGLAYILYRIDKRALVIGTLLLALSSILMMIPTQPYPGALLPINMAMATTRNIEYLLFIGSIILLVKHRSIRSHTTWMAIGLLALVFASDKLFLDIALASGFVALIVYAMRRRFKQVSLSVDWLLVSAVAAVLALVIIAVISLPGITNTAGSDGTGPYGLLSSPKKLVLSVGYAVTGLFTNFGANPVVSALTIQTIPSELRSAFGSVSILSSLWNVVLCVISILAMYKIVVGSFSKKFDKTNNTKAAQVVLLVIWAGLASLAAFVITDHYFVVDARYLSLFLFAGMMSIAVLGRLRKYQPSLLLVIGIVSVVSVGFGAVGAMQRYQADIAATSDVTTRNERIAGVLANHKVAVLVGDYWRVLPLKNTLKSQQVSPLASCTTTRDVLTSSKWNPDLHRTSFAYLLTLDAGLTGYEPCKLSQIIATYGKPNASALISGSLSNPKELLLFYDRGIRTTSKDASNPVPATVLPISLESLPNVSCNAPTIMNIVAHEDDDLLFMNPDTTASIAEGKCVRTVYMTAGDSGSGAAYWLSRERGSEAAYATMMQNNDVWIERIVSLTDHSYVTVATSKANPKVSLLFMHLPDGSIHGDGFGTSKYQSLTKLANGEVAKISTVDRQSTYTDGEVTNALVSLMRTYHPSIVRTQSSYVDQTYPDHSDHITVGNYATTAHALYEAEQFNNTISIPIEYYIGYPIRNFAENVFDEAAQRKAAAFLAYARFDGGVCRSIDECATTPTYGAYLQRQYRAER